MDMFNSIMSPLGKEYCVIFYVFGLIAFAAATIALVTGLYRLLNKTTRSSGLNFIWNSLTLYLIYLLYRIYNTVCVRVL